MVVTDNLLDEAKSQSINLFDAVTHFAFGSGTGTPTEAQSTLNSEVYRNAIFDSVKDLGNDLYEFTGRLPITQGNSVTITEAGVFNSETNGNMFARTLISDSFTKTSDDEYIVTLRIKVNAVDV